MIPNTGDDLRQDFIFTTLPSRTFKMNHDTLTITGTVDQIRAVEQAVFLILNTERKLNAGSGKPCCKMIGSRRLKIFSLK